jgi:hypothetical protein
MSTITPEQLIRSNPGIWLETFGKIRDVKGRNVQPVMNILQRRFNALYVSRFLAGKPLRGILVKPRKRGASTVVGGAHYHQLMNFRHEGVIIGDKLDTSDIVFRMMQNYAETDGYRGQWGSDYTSTTEEMKWEHGSVLRQATARGKATVRGLTPQFIHGTEAAHWENPEETMDAALNAIPDSGFNVVLLESTPFGAEGPFFNTWKGGRWPKAEESPGGKLYWKKWESLCPDQPPDASGLSESYFVRIFAAWYEFEDSHIRLTPEQKQEMERTLDAESWYAGEKKLMDLYLTDGPKGPRLGDEVVDCDVWEQLAWRRVTIKTKCRSSVRIFQEEHPDDPHSCFTSSGRQVFDDDALTHIQLLCRKNVDTGNVDDSKERAIWSTTGHDGATIHRWEPPKIGCRYLMSVDLAEGEDQTKGDDPDAHSALVWRDEYLDHNQVLWPIKLAARVRYGNRMPMIPFARLARALSSYYGNCMIIPEMNNSGMAFITALRAMTDKPCPPIWQRKERDPHSGIERAWDGWRTTDRAEYGGVRSTIIWHFHELIRNKKVEICCPHYHSELASFVDKKGRMEAGSGHDDDVISGCIGVYNIGSATTYSLAETQRFIPPEIAALEKLSEHTDGLAMKW